MDDILAKKNRHLFLEEKDNQNNSFIRNINYAVENIDTIKTFNDNVNNGTMQHLLEAYLEQVGTEGNAWVLRLTELGENILATTSGFNYAAVLTANQDIEAEATIALPEAMKYRVGTHMLLVSWNGTVCYNGEQYEEVGAFNEGSNTIKIKQAIKAGDKLEFRTVALADTSSLNIDLGDIVTSYAFPINSSNAERTLKERFLDIINVKDCGAKGDGIADDTSAIQMAFDCDISTVYFPDGTYSVSELFLTKKKKLLFNESAVVKANTAFQRRFALLTIGEGADGSSVTGGTFDGNRAELSSDYEERDWLWRLIEVKDASDVVIHNVTLQNSTANSIVVTRAPRTVVDGLNVYNCTKWFALEHGSDGSIISNVIAKDISNETSDVYAHGCEIRRSNYLTISNVYIENFSPNGAYQREPTPVAMSLDRIKGLNLSNITIDGYGGSSSSGLQDGILIESSTHVNASNLVVRGFLKGLVIHRCIDAKIDGFTVDGEYASNAVSAGNVQALVEIESIGIANDMAAGDVQYQLSFGDVRMPGSAVDITLSNGTVKRGRGNGIQIYGGNDILLSNVTVQAINQHGVSVYVPNGYGSYSQFGQKDLSGKVKIYGCRFSCIGYAGVAGIIAENVDICGCTFSWCSILARTSSTDLYKNYISGFSGCKNLFVDNCQFSAVDNASLLTSSSVVSWMPNNYDAESGTHTVFCGYSSILPIGGVVKISGATANANDTFKVVDYDMRTCKAKLQAVDNVVTSSFLVSGSVLNAVTLSNVSTDSEGGAISGTADFSEVPPYAAVKLVINGTTYWRNNANTGTAGLMALSEAVPANATVTSVHFIAAAPEMYSEAIKPVAVTGSGNESSPNKYSITNIKLSDSFSTYPYENSYQSIDRTRNISFYPTICGRVAIKDSRTASNGKIVLGNGFEKSGSYAVQLHGNGYVDDETLLGSFFPDVMWNAGESSDADALVNLGTPTRRWRQVYAATGSIQTSDFRVKTNIAAPSNALMRAWGRVSFKVFQFLSAIDEKGVDSARLHIGLIAQEVKDAFEAEGLDAFRYGLLCYDEWPDKYEEEVVVDDPGEYDENGLETRKPVEHIVQKLVQKAGNLYGIRYEEALALECAYQRWLGEQRDAKIKALMQRISALENNN